MGLNYLINRFVDGLPGCNKVQSRWGRCRENNSMSSRARRLSCSAWLVSVMWDVSYVIQRMSVCLCTAVLSTVTSIFVLSIH